MWTATAIFFYILPFVGFLLIRPRAGRDAILLALDLPLVVAADFVLILLTSRLFVLDYAALVVRAVELVALVALAVSRRAGFRLSLKNPTALIAPALGAALALYLSTRISVPYAIWDRHWHIPLVTSLRGQHAPFHNVYEPGRPLYYHYAGDALAAIFQALSLSHLHASAALSRAHDVMYGLTGWFLCAALRAFGSKATPLHLLVVAGVLAGGPATVFFEGTERFGSGWSITSLLSLGFRPHDPLAFFFACVLLLAAVAPLWSETLSRRSLLPPIALAVAMLALSDEPTLAIAIGTVSVVWLLAPAPAIASWRERLLLLATPLAATMLTVLLLGGTFSPGAPHQAIELVSPRLPGFYLASRLFSAKDTFMVFFADYAMPLGVLVAGLVSALARRTPGGFVLWTANLALVVASLGILLLVRVNHDDMESHRAATAMLVLSPLLLGLWFIRLPPTEPRAWVLGIGGIVCLLGIFSSIEWVRGRAQVDAPRLHSFWGDDWFYKTDCVKTTGARLGERATFSLGPTTRWYDFGGCRPVFTVPGGPPGGHAIVVGWPDADTTAFAKLATWAAGAPGEVRLFYPQSEQQRGGAVVERIRKSASCVRAGSDFMECRLSTAEFAARFGPAKPAG